MFKFIPLDNIQCTMYQPVHCTLRIKRTLYNVLHITSNKITFAYHLVLLPHYITPLCRSIFLHSACCTFQTHSLQNVFAFNFADFEQKEFNCFTKPDSFIVLLPNKTTVRWFSKLKGRCHKTFSQWHGCFCFENSLLNISYSFLKISNFQAFTKLLKC